MTTLTPTDLDVLAVAKTLGTFPDVGGSHWQYIQTHAPFGVTTFYQHLNRLLDNEAALATEPILIYRLRRIRDQRTARRTPEV